jgi:hypothetical protein
MTFLAPQWVEGLWKKEFDATTRMTGLASLAGKRRGLTKLGTTGTAVARGMLFMAGLTQAINLITRGQPTWKNKEDGHKLDAWIPSVDSDKEGFWLSPLAVYNELTHDLYRIYNQRQNWADTVGQIAGNKESPVSRALGILISGNNQQGEHITSTAGRLGAAAAAAIPTPITFGKFAQAAGHAIAPGLVHAVQPGALQRQALATFAGLKTEPALSITANVQRQAQQFMRDHGLQKETGWMEIQTDEPGYTKLRQALRYGDTAKAEKILNELRKGRTDSQIIKAMRQWARRGFTGSRKTERLFTNSMDDEQREQYAQAVDAKYAELQKFEEWYSSLP